MTISVEDIKKLREETGCGVIDCKKALSKSNGDYKQAKEMLKQQGLELAAKKANRIAKEGRVEAYAHLGNKIAVLLEVNCETDFVARNEDFIRFCKDVAMHIAWSNPKYISPKDVPSDVLSAVEDQTVFLKEKCLLNQLFVKDQSKTVQDYLSELIAKIGENILIGRFIRYKVGESE